jgi:ArsR family transcriptional regulator
MPPFDSITYVCTYVIFSKPDIYVKPYILRYAIRTRNTAIVDMELFFRALADQTRLRLLNLMDDDEVCVCFFVAVLETNQPKISRHLAYLRRAGLVAARRDGKWMHYRVTAPDDPTASRILADVREWLKTDKGMQRDRKRLSRICCSPTALVELGGAPVPG